MSEAAENDQKSHDIANAVRSGEADPREVPSADIDSRVAFQMVQVDASTIQRVPEEFRDKDVVEMAILSGGESALMYLPKELTNPGVDYEDMSHMQQVVQDAMEKLQVIEDVAGGDYQAFQVHEALKDGKLAVEDMTEQQMESLNSINWDVSVSVTFEGQSFDEAFILENDPGIDSGWMGAMDRTADVEMKSHGGLTIEFGVQTEPANGYSSVETLREFYDSQVDVDGNADATVAGKKVHSEISELAAALRGHWENQALQEVGNIPQEYESFADRNFSDIAIDQTLEVARNEAGELAVSFSIQQGDQPIEFTMDTYSAASLSTADPVTPEITAAAQAYVAENAVAIGEQVDSFKREEIGLTNVAVDNFEGAYFANFELQGQSVSVDLDTETLKPILDQPHGVPYLDNNVQEVVATEIAKQVEGMTPPMGIERAGELAKDLGEVLDKDVAVVDNGGSYQVYIGEKGGDDAMRHSGTYSSLSELNEDLREQLTDARAEKQGETTPEIEGRKHDKIEKEERKKERSMRI